MKKSLLIILGVAVVILIFASYYNQLVSKNEAVAAQWAQVETQYQRRFDLIPNLVASVEGIMAQEQTVFETIAQARSQYANSQSVEEKVAAANEVESSLSRLLVIMENYPQLGSSENVTRLMDELAGTENRVAVERRRFNDLVEEYNVLVKRFPGSLLAALFGFDQKLFFTSAEGASVAPNVDINPQ